MTKVGRHPVYGKNLLKSSSPEPSDLWPWNLGCNIRYASTAKIVQCPLVDLDSFYAKVKYGFVWEKVIHVIIYFLNFCSRRSQKWLKHLTKLVYEVLSDLG